MASVDNKGRGGAVYNLDPLGTLTHVAPTISDLATEFKFFVGQGGANSPRSRAYYLDGEPEVELLEVDKASPWPNTGSLGGSMALVSEPIQDIHFNTPITTGNYLSIPHNANLTFSASQTVEIVMRLSFSVWLDTVNAPSGSVLVAKGNASNEWKLLVNHKGQVGLQWGSATVNYTTSGIPANRGETFWLRVVRTSGTVSYYYAPDQTAEPTTWLLFSTTSTVVATPASTTTIVTVGQIPSVTSHKLIGRIYNVILRTASAGTTVLNINVPVDCAAMTPDVTTTFTATSGQTVTLVTAGTPPATIRVISPSAISLPYPYYEMVVPPELTLRRAGFTNNPLNILAWAKLNITAMPSGTNVVPLLSLTGSWSTVKQLYGITIGYDPATRRLNDFTAVSNSTNMNWYPTEWTTYQTLPVSGEVWVLLGLRPGSPTTQAYYQMLLFDSTGTLIGDDLSAGFIANPGSVVDWKFQVHDLPGEIDVEAIGLVGYNNSPNTWDGNVYQIMQRVIAADGQPVWNEGDAIYVNETTTAFTGDAVSVGDVIVATSPDGTAENAATWQVTPLAGNTPAWIREPNPLGVVDLGLFAPGVSVGATESFFSWMLLDTKPSTTSQTYSYMELGAGIYWDFDNSSTDNYLWLWASDALGEDQEGDSDTHPAPTGQTLMAVWFDRFGDVGTLYYWIDTMSDIEVADDNGLWTPGVVNPLPVSKFNVYMAASTSIPAWGYDVSKRPYRLSVARLTAFKAAVLASLS